MLHRTIIFYFQEKYHEKSLKDCARQAEHGCAKLIISSAIGSGNSPEINGDRYAVEGSQLFMSSKAFLPHEKLDSYSEVGKKHHAELTSLSKKEPNAFIV